MPARTAGLAGDPVLCRYHWWCRPTFLIASGLKATLIVFLQSRVLQVKAELPSSVCSPMRGK